MVLVISMGALGCSESGNDEPGGGAKGDASGAPCKGPDAVDCPKGEYCSAPGICPMAVGPDGGMMAVPFDGTCANRPTSCPSECDFACGANGIAYCNECQARKAGAEVASYCTVCPEYRAPCSTDQDCVLGLKCCKPVCPYPTGCGDAGVGAMCEKTVNGACPVPG